MEDSSSLMPVRVKTAPWPELKRGLSSRRETAKVTVSRAEVDAVEVLERGKVGGVVRNAWERVRMRRRESLCVLLVICG